MCFKQQSRGLSFLLALCWFFNSFFPYPFIWAPVYLRRKPTQTVTGLSSIASWKHQENSLWWKPFQVELLSSSCRSLWFCGKICQSELWKWLSAVSGDYTRAGQTGLCERVSLCYPSVFGLFGNLKRAFYYLITNITCHIFIYKVYCHMWNKEYHLLFENMISWQKLFWAVLIYLAGI